MTYTFVKLYFSVCTTIPLKTARAAHRPLNANRWRQLEEQQGFLPAEKTANYRRSALLFWIRRHRVLSSRSTGFHRQQDISEFGRWHVPEPKLLINIIHYPTVLTDGVQFGHVFFSFLTPHSNAPQKKQNKKKYTLMYNIFHLLLST